MFHYIPLNNAQKENTIEKILDLMWAFNLISKERNP